MCIHGNDWTFWAEPLITTKEKYWWLSRWRDANHRDIHVSNAQRKIWQADSHYQWTNINRKQHPFNRFSVPEVKLSSFPCVHSIATLEMTFPIAHWLFHMHPLFSPFSHSLFPPIVFFFAAFARTIGGRNDFLFRYSRISSIQHLFHSLVMMGG